MKVNILSFFQLINRVVLSIFLLFLFQFIGIEANAQYDFQQKKDSLSKFVNSVFDEGSPLIINLVNRNIPNDSSQFYHELLDEFTTNENNYKPQQKLETLISIALLEQKYNLLHKCIPKYLSSLALLKEAPNDRVEFFVNMKLATAYRQNGNFDLANKLFYLCVDNSTLDSSDYPRWMVQSFIAENHEILGENVMAMDACIKLQDVYLEKGMLAEASYNLIQQGRIASHLETDTFYFEYYHRAVEMAYMSKKKSRIANNLVNLAMAYRTDGYPNKALRYFDEARPFNEYSRPYPRAYFYLHLATAYYDINMIDSALQNAKISFNTVKKIDASVMEYAACHLMSKCFEKMNRDDSAIFYLQKALVFQSETFMANDANAYRHMSKLATKLGDYESALAYLDSSYTQYVRVVDKENIDKLAKLREKSDYYIHRARIGDLVLDNQQEREKSKNILFISVGIALILTLSIFFIIVIRKRLNQLQQSYINLVEKNIALDKLNKRANECEMKMSSKVDYENLKDEQRILKKLKKLLIKDEVYLNQNISLASLSKTLKTNTSYLSAIINSHYSMNFRSLINSYRIIKAKEMFVSEHYTNYSVEGVAQEVGFNSRSSFYQAFKSETGLTPALFLKNYKIIQEERAKKSNKE